MTNFIELSFDSGVNNHSEFTLLAARRTPRKTGASSEINRISVAVVGLINKLCFVIRIGYSAEIT